MTPKPMWEPSRERVAQSNLTAFMAQVAADYGASCRDYGELYRWSVEKIDDF